MGSFEGHAVPGIFFILWAMWWIFRMFMRYFNSLSHGGKPYVNTVTHSPTSTCCPRFDIEAMLIVAAGIIGIIIEIPIASYLKHHPVTVGNGQHATMYFFFGLIGFTALLLNKVKFLPFRDDLQYCCLFLAYVVEGLLFSFHLYGRDELDVVLHTLLVYTVEACALATLLEAWLKNSLISGLTRAFCTFLQGTWFVQVGYILYNPFGEPWSISDEHSKHEVLMSVPLIFTWHVGVILVLLCLTGLGLGCIYHKRGRFDERKMSKYSRGNGYKMMVEEADEAV